jgi:hypothetical protein
MQETVEAGKRLKEEADASAWWKRQLMKIKKV